MNRLPKILVGMPYTSLHELEKNPSDHLVPLTNPRNMGTGCAQDKDLPMPSPEVLIKALGALEADPLLEPWSHREGAALCAWTYTGAGEKEEWRLSPEEEIGVSAPSVCSIYPLLRWVFLGGRTGGLGAMIKTITGEDLPPLTQPPKRGGSYHYWVLDAERLTLARNIRRAQQRQHDLAERPVSRIARPRVRA